MTDISFTQNRELSWLKFNERVLDEAQDERVPLFERLKFLSIFDSNLDEFFMVRVGSLTDLSMMQKKVIDNKSLMDAEEQLNAIMEETKLLYQKKDHIYNDLSEHFRAMGTYSVDFGELRSHEKDYLKVYFDNSIGPILNYQIVDITHPFPHVPNLGIMILYLLKDKETEESRIGIIQIPQQVKRLVELGNNKRILIESIIKVYGRNLFDNYEVLDEYVLSVTRNADIDFEDEDYELEDDYRSHMKKMLKKRKRLLPVRLEMDREPSKEIEDFLLENLNLKRNRIFVTKSPMRLNYLFDYYDALVDQYGTDSQYVDTIFKPQKSRYVDPNRSIMAQIQHKDLLLSYPYESMDPIIKLLEEAANDPDVVSIKITLYRIAKDSKVAEQLIAAAENGKDVVVLMELRARFDEENNILWSANLERAGCRVIYGFNHFKCHSKVLLITKMVNGQVKYLSQVATGNYNEKTAKMYTDFSLCTYNQDIGRDVNALFDNFLTGNLNGSYDKLMVSPKSMQEGLERLFNEQIAISKNGGEGYIRLKMNSISDRILIDKISEASNAGVTIDMMVRGITCIIPGIANRTENLHIYSVVGRFLEHHRIYQFGKGSDAQIYISSADFMTRNIRKRVEVACPILDVTIQKRVLDFMDTMFADDVKIRELLPTGRYALVKNEDNFIAQDELMKEAIQYSKVIPEKHPEGQDEAVKDNSIEKTSKEEKPKRRGFFAWLFGR